MSPTNVAAAYDCGDTGKNHAAMLDVSAQEFLTHLGLPTVHPLCRDSSNDIVDDDDDAVIATTAMKKKTELDYILTRINDGSIFELPNLLVGTASSSILPPHTSTITPLPPPKAGPIPLLELHNNSIYTNYY
jgi:hypothetical protein